jgi:GntR family transcriptional regulator
VAISFIRILIFHDVRRCGRSNARDRSREIGRLKQNPAVQPAGCVPRCIMALRHMPAPAQPVYLKLREQIVAGIIDGAYPEGTMLPSVRAFAAAAGANPLTVAKAYQSFQLDGLIEVQRGVGMFVAAGAADRLRRSERAAFLAEEWPAIRARIARLGLANADLFA